MTNFYLVSNTPTFQDTTQGHCSLQHSISIAISRGVIFYFWGGYYTNSWTEGVRKALIDLSGLGHHCLCMPLFLGSSVKAPLRADCYLSLWSPYLFTTSLLLMILKPLFSLKRVCPVPVKREQQMQKDRDLFIVR